MLDDELGDTTDEVVVVVTSIDELCEEDVDGGPQLEKVLEVEIVDVTAAIGELGVADDDDDDISPGDDEDDGGDDDDDNAISEFMEVFEYVEMVRVVDELIIGKSVKGAV